MRRISQWLTIAFMLWIPVFAHYLDIEGDFLYLKRNLAANNVIMETPTETLTTKRLASDFNYSTGLQAKGTFYATTNEAIQIRYTGLVSYHSSIQIAQIGSITFPFTSDINVYDWVDADRARAFYDSDYFEFDLSYYNIFEPRWNNYFSLDWGVGLDYVEIKEDFKLRYYVDYRTSKYDIKTINTLLGGHILGEIVAQPYKWLAWGLQARFGINANLMRMHQLLFDNNQDVSIMNQSAQKVRPNYMGEIDPYIIFRPVPAVHIVIGYTWIYYRGIALAPNQINYAPASLNGVRHGGQVNYQGFYAGLGLVF
ncbi:MAG: hypothetical protein HY860_03765 [Chlamydiales bacterium]|nr:hypothetical protein [Chlamydiales bacterium]